METLRYFTRRYPWQSVTVLCCLFAAGLLEGLGLSAVVPLLGLVLRGDGAGPAAAGGFESRVAEAFALVGLEPTVEVLVAFVCLVFPIKAGLLLLSNRRVGYMVAQVATDLRLGLLRALLASRWSYYARLPLGLAPNAMASEATRAAQAYHYLAQVLSGAFEVLFAMVIASAISWRVTLAASAAGAFTIAVLNVFVRMTKRAGLKQTTVLRSLVRQLSTRCRRSSSSRRPGGTRSSGRCSRRTRSASTRPCASRCSPRSRCARSRSPSWSSSA